MRLSANLFLNYHAEIAGVAEFCNQHFYSLRSLRSQREPATLNSPDFDLWQGL